MDRAAYQVDLAKFFRQLRRIAVFQVPGEEFRFREVLLVDFARQVPAVKTGYDFNAGLARAPTAAAGSTE